MRIKIQHQGTKELSELFKQLPEKITSRALAAGTLAGARVIAKAAKANAPRDTYVSKLNQRYGTLRSNIKARGLKKKYENVRASIVSIGNAFWGGFLERGTRYIAATRWYSRAHDSSEKQAADTMNRYIVAKITQEANRLINRLGL